MKIRNVKSEDYYTISPLINEWWGGRQMSDMLPKLFFDHFNHTSFVAVKDGEVVGFLIGFLSQSHSYLSYIHFVGVHPNYRNLQIGSKLYNEFYRVSKENNRNIVKAITSPVNQTSIAYHTKMGFDIEKGDKLVDGVSVFTDYDGVGEDRVVFNKILFKE